MKPGTVYFGQSTRSKAIAEAGKSKSAWNCPQRAGKSAGPGDAVSGLREGTFSKELEDSSGQTASKQGPSIALRPSSCR